MKRSIKFVLLLVVLALCVGGYVMVQQNAIKETVSETKGAFALTEKTAADVAGEARKAANFSEKSGFYRVILK